MSNTVKFATFGPNRGLSLNIGAYEFTDGICEVQEKDAAAAASILTRYHDVCHAHELEQKIAEYDTAQQNKEAATSNPPQPETPAPPANPEPEPKPETPTPAPAEESPEPAPAAAQEAPTAESAPATEKEPPAEGEEKKRGAHKKQKQHADA